MDQAGDRADPVTPPRRALRKEVARHGETGGFPSKKWRMTEATPLTVLMVSGDRGGGSAMRTLLQEGGAPDWNLVVAGSAEDARERLYGGRVGAVLLDGTRLWDRPSEMVRLLVDDAGGVPILVLGRGEEDCPPAVCIEAGAQDCLVRETLSGPMLVHAIRFAVERKRWEGERRAGVAALHESETRFRTALRHAPIGMALVALDGRFLEVNRALCRIVGYDEEELLGLTFQEITHPEDVEPDLAQARRLLEGEIPVYELEKRYIHREGRTVWVLLTGSIVRDAEGRPMYYIAQVQDITARKETEDAIRFLGEAGQVLASSLDDEKTLRTLAQLAVPRLADWCVVELREGNWMQPVEGVAADPATEALLLEMWARYPAEPGSMRHPLGRVLQGGRPILWPQVRQDMLKEIARDERHLHMLMEIAPASMMMVPLTSRGRTFGALTFGRSKSGRRYGPQDLATAEDLAYTAALTIDNAFLLQEARQRTPAQGREKTVHAGAHAGAALGTTSGSSPTLQPRGKPVRVLIVHEQPLLRRGIADVLAAEPWVEVAGEAASGEEAVASVDEIRPDAVVMKLTGGEIGGVEATRRISTAHPETRVLLLTGLEGTPVAEALGAGASACMSSAATAEQLVAALQTAMHGGLVLDPVTGALPASARGDAAPAPLDRLSPQEREVLSLAARGFTAVQIGKKVFLSPKTVETYRSRAMRKLGLESRADLVALAVRSGLLAV
jgi:PAS domain S-box-containing protein